MFYIHFREPRKVLTELDSFKKRCSSLCKEEDEKLQRIVPLIFYWMPFGEDFQGIDSDTSYEEPKTIDKARFQAQKNLPVFCHFLSAFICFKENNYWPYPFSQSDETQKEIIQFCETLCNSDELLSEQLRGIIDYCFRKNQSSLVKEWNTNSHHDLFFSLRQKGDNLLKEYFPKMADTHPPLLWNVKWLPEGAKACLFLNLMQINMRSIIGLRDKLSFLSLMAPQSGLGVMILTLRFWRGKLLSDEDLKTILPLCAASSGLRILPHLADFALSSEEITPILDIAIDNTKAEHFYAFHPSEILHYLSTIPLQEGLIQRIEEKRASIAPHSPKFAVQTPTLHKNLIKNWKRLYEEKGEANRLYFENTLKEIEVLGTEESDAIKLLTIQRLFKKRPEAILETLSLFRIERAGTKKIFYEHACKIWPNLLLQALSDLEMDEEDKIEILSNLCREPRSASLIVNNFNIYNLSLEEPRHFGILKEAVEIASQKNGVRLTHLNLDPENPLHASLIAKCVIDALQKQAPNHELGATVFTRYDALFTIDPRLKQIEPILALAHLVWVRLDELHVCGMQQVANLSTYPQQVREALLIIRENSPEIGDLLSWMWEKRKIEKILQEIHSNPKSATYKQKCFELNEANRGFQAVIKAYLLINYRADLGLAQPQEQLATLKIIIENLEKLNAQPEVLENIFNLVCETCTWSDRPITFPSPPEDLKKTYFASLYPLFSFLTQSSTDFESVQKMSDLDFAWLQKVFSKDIVQNFLAFFSSFSGTNLPASTEAHTIIFLIRELARQQESVEIAQKICRRILCALAVLAKLKEKEPLSEILLNGDIDILERNMIIKVAALFSIPEENHPLILTTLQNWEHPELLFTYYAQWEKNAKVIQALAKWFRHVIQGPKAYLDFRFGGEDRQSYFADFPKEIVASYREESLFDLTRTTEIWKSKEPKPSEKSQSFQSILQSEALFLFRFQIGDALLSFDTLPPSTNWAAWMNKIKQLHSKDFDMQKKQIARFKVLKNLIILAQSDNRRISLKAAVELQNLLGMNQELWESEGFSKETLQKVNPLLAQFIAFCQSKNPLEGLEILFTHNPQILFTMAEKALGSCQSITGKADQNRALIGRIHHGKQKMLIIRSQKTGEPIGAVTIKLLKDLDGRPVLLREPVYQCTGCKLTSLQLEEIATLALLDFVQTWDIPLIVGILEEDQENALQKSQSPYFEIAQYPTPIKSDPGSSLFEYEDTCRLQVQKKEYTLPITNLLAFRLNY